MPTIDQRARRRILDIALSLFERAGYADTTLAHVAEEAGVPLEEVYRHYPLKEGLVLALYHRLAADLEGRVEELPKGRVGPRFHAAMTAKLDLLEPHHAALGALFAAGIDPSSRLGVLGEHTDAVRRRVAGVFAAVVQGAADRPPAPRDARLARLLYALHLGLILCWTLDRTPGRASTRAAVDLARDLLAFGVRFARVPGLGRLVGRLLERTQGIVGGILVPPNDPERHGAAENVLRRVFRHRRLRPDAGACAKSPCSACLALHLPLVESFVEAGRPVHFVLPAFPAKSPSERKVLGRLPDLGEELSLGFLQSVCEEVREVYPPGARITICSDGRAFGRLVGVEDEDVTRYGREIEALVARLGDTALDVFRMEDAFDGTDFDAMRRLLDERYSEPLETVRARCREHDHHRRLFDGIHRFLFEDRVEVEAGKSRNKVREETKELAYEVIRRSNAWGRLIAECFPSALRLSIHPQSPHADKIGILLVPAEDAWLTPWHGAAVLEADRFTLRKRREAEEKGAAVVCGPDGRPSHLAMPSAKTTSR
ncbi:MAG: L-tyrosine/L-tryptophan isonitrile synthase family protein [Planctomycetes bacterium]|nr:L-tyrosine/L-tryptophan isonitrile synthase family protein [Planctomycetota bacterium]